MGEGGVIAEEKRGGGGSYDYVRLDLGGHDRVAAYPIAG